MNITNHKAYFEYNIVSQFEAGIVLNGPEVKSLRSGHAKLDGSYVKLIGLEAYLVGANIYPYINSHIPLEKYDPRRTRKLLFHKKELLKLKTKLDSTNLTLVPLKFYTKGSNIKLEVALASGKKQYEKKEKQKREDLKIELERDFRGKIK